MYIDDPRCSPVWTSLPERARPARPAGAPPGLRELYPNSSVYKVLENLIFNSLKFYSLIYITVKVDRGTVPDDSFALEFLHEIISPYRKVNVSI